MKSAPARRIDVSDSRIVRSRSIQPLRAAAMIMLMLFTAERTWGLGKVWQRTHLVQRFPWLA